MRLRDAGIADEFDRVCAVYYQEWFDAREEYRLKRVLNWFMGGEEKSGKQKACTHRRFETLPNGELKCRDCGAVGN